MMFTESLSAQGRALCDARMARHRFARGDAVVVKGDAVSGAYFVLSGRLRVFTYGPSGKEATLYTLNRGETCILALNSLFAGMRYPAWVEAEAATEVGLLPGPIYRDLFAREPAIQDITVRALSSAALRLMAELEQVHTASLGQRLANYLLSQADASGVVRNTQQDIAARIGTTREVVGRLMARHAKAGNLSTRRGRITLLDTRALAELCLPSDDGSGDYGDGFG